MVGLNGNSDCPQMTIDGYVFFQWDFNLKQGCIGDAWLARKEIEANSCIEAMNHFKKDFDQIIQKVAFVSQCYMDYYREPFLIYKLDNNSKNIFFYKHIQEINGVGLHFNEEVLKNYKKLENFEHTLAFRFLQECCNTIGYIPKLILLFSALEAMCGKKENEKDGKTYFTYDKDEMKKIIGNQLFGEVFGDNGIRHKLNHGEIVDLVFGQDYVEAIYRKIILYFNNEYDVKIDASVVHPQRHFYNNHEFVNLWLRPNDNFEINLKDCINNFNEKNNSITGCEYLDVNPNNYLWVLPSKL